MSIIISYDAYQADWYVGELYQYFHKYLLTINSDIFFIPIQNLCQQYNEPFNYNNNCPSLFNIYSLIVINTKKHNGFLCNFSDYAPVILEHKSAIDKLNINCFSMCSNLTQDHINKYKGYKIIPSFYILENWSDYKLINHFFNLNQPKINKCYFNGLSYGYRINYINQLRSNSFFDFKDKTKSSEYRQKQDYYKDLYQSKYGLSLNGAAKICYRDLELFGLGVLNLREPLNILIKDQLLPNIHYKIILDDFIRNNIYYPEKTNEIIQKIISNIEDISDTEYEFITHNARQWFVKNVSPDEQISFLKQCLIENNIL